ncbi:uncharacterized protein LOC122402583 [Colletes gigas]|uniref:uncharacterized protein LOC122402583 n=1 Tax=Colletes gigas TaxID=935657 RepID=UPI001C9BB32B|nr:uncharacterized protein LOC122402583 [Colletes gigas]
MPQIMVQAFAKGLVDKILLEAFGTMDPNDEKLRALDGREKSADVRSQSTMQIHEQPSTNHNESETTELIEKMVCGLRNLQIGDSTSVPSFLSNLEKQVKYVVYNIDNTSEEMSVTHGQGDVQQITHNAVIETEPSRLRQEKENCDSNEITGVSVSLLHRMIEELETKAENESDSICKEGIAVWEETEERLIRTIENVDHDRNIALPSESSSKNNVNDEVLTSSCLAYPSPFAKNVSLEDIVIEGITPSSFFDRKSPSSSMARGESKNYGTAKRSRNRKKSHFLSRMRKMMRVVFGRRKN